MKIRDQRSAWYSHTESILQALLCSVQDEERRWAVNSLRETWEESLGNINPRSRRTPTLNFEAISVNDLVNWDTKTVCGPSLYCRPFTGQIRYFYAFLMEVSSWFTHTQVVERIVKMVTDAYGKQNREERREGMSKYQKVSRE